MNAAEVQLYRLENVDLPYTHPIDDIYFNRAIAGQWFDPTLDGAISQAGNRVGYLSKTHNTPAQIAIATVMADSLSAYHASSHPIASSMNYCNDDYIIPRDGSVPIVSVDVTETLCIPGGRSKIIDIVAQFVKQQFGRDMISGPGGRY